LVKKKKKRRSRKKSRVSKINELTGEAVSLGVGAGVTASVYASLLPISGAGAGTLGRMLPTTMRAFELGGTALQVKSAKNVLDEVEKLGK